MSTQCIVYLVRHGETEWSRTGRHTGRTDIPLTEAGEQQARCAAQALRGHEFVRVYTSSLQRVTRTCELAGYAGRARDDEDLVEWDYGDYEGLDAEAIQAKRPGWELFRDGCPDGESPDQVAVRADRLIGRVREHSGEVLVFSSGDVLRMIAARWLGLEPARGALFHLATASTSVLAYDPDGASPHLQRWNDTSYLK